MTSPIADGVITATHKLVQQAMTGRWQDVPKTIEERRLMLDQLSATATPQDQQWLGALKQAMAESDAAVARMSQADGSTDATRTHARTTGERTEAAGRADTVESMIDMIRGSR